MSVIRLAPGAITWAELSWMTGPAWAGTAQPAAMTVPRMASAHAAAFRPGQRRVRREGRFECIGADMGVRSEAAVLGITTDLTYAGQLMISRALTDRPSGTSAPRPPAAAARCRALRASSEALWASCPGLDHVDA